MPERGINALDAAVAAYTNISLLRQQTKAGVRIYHTIQGSERWTANRKQGTQQTVDRRDKTLTSSDTQRVYICCWHPHSKRERHI